MIEAFASTEKLAGARGEEFGARFATNIARNIETYHRLFRASGRWTLEEIREYAMAAFSVVRSYAPRIAEEIHGIAVGANALLSDVMALNARTELLATCLVKSSPQECSAVISLNADQKSGSPLALQTWDWLTELSEGWLLWTFEGVDGHTIRMLTEYGIVGKIGVNSAGVGVMVNILSHEQDGQLPIGLPIHVALRSILEERHSVNAEVARITSTSFTASSAISVILKSGPDVSAFTVEVSPRGPAFCLPDSEGLLVHSNHFLSTEGAKGDCAPRLGPSSYVRYEQLRRRLRGGRPLVTSEVLQVMASHVGGSHALCSHPLSGAPLAQRSETLAVVQLDVAAGTLRARRGGPCASGSWTTLGGEL